MRGGGPCGRPGWLKNVQTPWPDVTMTNPDIIREVDTVDPILGVQGLIDAGELYANGNDRTSPIISPIYGSFENLGHITLFTGMHDVLWPDARKFKAKAEAEGVEIDYHEYKDMVHVWMLLPWPEAKQVLRQIVEMLTTR